MSKMKITVEIEVPDATNKYMKYGLARGALDQAASQLAEERSSGTISFTTAKGSWEINEVDQDD